MITKKKPSIIIPPLILHCRRMAETWLESESYSLVSFFSDVGGSMGLLLGLSIYSLVAEVAAAAMGAMAATAKS